MLVLGTGFMVFGLPYPVSKEFGGGIPGVADGTRKAAVFVDGRLNSGYWGGGTGKTLTVPTNGRFGLLCHQGVTSGRIVYDNLKIWKFAKTDFSDRNDE
ncbi:hypothetical protein LBMAG57_10390 [Verrucomicrobiota bacterium]|nr:hypothetical protein LBMAG57_10390 [Verrucomicrobiota bacterium]